MIEKLFLWFCFREGIKKILFVQKPLLGKESFGKRVFYVLIISSNFVFLITLLQNKITLLTKKLLTMEDL